MAVSSIMEPTELENIIPIKNIIPNIRVRVQLQYVYRFIFYGGGTMIFIDFNRLTDFCVFFFNNQLFKKLEFVETNCQNHPNSEDHCKKRLANKP